MSSLEESIHQVFSSVLSHTRERDTIVFEEEAFKPSRGIFNSSHVAILDGSTGLIGSGHPLYIKSALQSAIKGEVLAEKNHREKVIEAFEAFLSKVIGENVSLTNPKGSFNELDTRVPEFLTKSSLDKLNAGDSITLEGLLPESFAIQKGRLESNNYFGLKSNFNLRFCENLIRFLDLGQFYGSNGLIKNREGQLKDILGDLNSIKSFNGLLVEFDSSKSTTQIKSHNDYLIFPTSFSADQLAELKKILEDGCLS